MRRALLLALLALAWAAPARGADDTAALVTKLGSSDTSEAYAAYRDLLSRRPPEALPLLAKALPGYPRTSQNYGWSLVQGYPPADVRKLAERWSLDAPPYLKGSAAVWLLRNGDAKGAPRLVEAVEAARADAMELQWLLGQMYGAKDARVQAAVRALLGPAADESVLGAALYHLWSVKDDASRDAAAALLGAGPGPKALAAAFLWRLGDEDRGAALAEALATGEVSFPAFSRVQSLLLGAGRLPDAVLEALLALIATPPPGYSLSVVVRLLGQQPYPKAVPVLKGLLDRDDETGKAAFEALSGIPGAIGPDVAKTLLEGADESRRVAAAEALRRTDDLSGLPAVVDVLKRGTKARADAARALGGFRVRAAVDPLIDALLDGDASVRAAAESSLASVLQSLFPYRRLDLDAAGYDSGKDAAQREAAVAKIRSWWQAHRDGAW